MAPIFARKKVILVLFELGLWAAFSLAMYWSWQRWLIPGPNGTIHWVGMDFVPYWVGVRAMLTGQSPYSSGTTHLIQEILLGGPPAVGGDPMLFVYPAWIFLLLVPLALLPLKWAVALWTGALLLGTIQLIGYLAYRCPAITCWCRWAWRWSPPGGRVVRSRGIRIRQQT